MDESREGYKNIKGFGLIPNHWDVLDLGNIMNFKNGLNYGKNDVGEEIKILGVGDFQKNFYVNTCDLNKIKYSDLDENYLLEKGDLIFVRSNGNKELIGRVLYCENIKERVTYSGFTIRGRLDSTNFIDKYCAYYCSSSLVKKQYMTNGGGTNINNLSQEILSNVKITKPPIKDQERIVTIISTFDRLIDLKEKLLQEKKIIKKALMQQLLTGSKRLKGFEDNEKNIKRLKSYLQECTARNKNNEIKRVLSVTNSRGFIKQSEQFDRTIASADVSEYKIVKNGEFGYNPSRVNVGSIDLLKNFDDGLLSPMYVVFKTKEDNLLPAYLYQYFKSRNFYEDMKNYLQGSVRQNLNFKALCQMKVFIPSLEEQQAISNILTTADKEISLLEEKLEILRDQKKGLMQDLLTGKVMVKV